MKITSVECYLGDKGLGGFVTVKVNTDEGISGFGEAGLAYGKCSEAAFGQCQDFARMVLGMDPFNTEEIWEHLHRHTFWGMGGGVVVTSAMAAIDTACWDIKGKALNMPVYKLIGGKTNKKLRAYASQLQFGWRTLIEKNDALTLLYDPKDYYDVVKDAMAEGYDAVKIDPVFAPLEERPMAEVMATQGNQIRGCYREHDLTRSVERIAAAREAGGPDLDIIVEIHSLLDANTWGRHWSPTASCIMRSPPCPAILVCSSTSRSGASCPWPLESGATRAGASASSLRTGRWISFSPTCATREASPRQRRSVTWPRCTMWAYRFMSAAAPSPRRRPCRWRRPSPTSSSMRSTMPIC